MPTISCRWRGSRQSLPQIHDVVGPARNSAAAIQSCLKTRGWLAARLVSREHMLSLLSSLYSRAIYLKLPIYLLTCYHSAACTVTLHVQDLSVCTIITAQRSSCYRFTLNGANATVRAVAYRYDRTMWPADMDVAPLPLTPAGAGSNFRIETNSTATVSPEVLVSLRKRMAIMLDTELCNAELAHLNAAIGMRQRLSSTASFR